MEPRRIAIVGPTATGKTALAIELAEQIDAEIISGDSMCVYRGMDIGTAKPTVGERGSVPHHLIDVAAPDEEFSLALFVRLVAEAIHDIEARGRAVILAGGTGLYVDAIVGGLTLPGQFPSARAEIEEEPDTAKLYARLAVLDPLAASRMEATNRRRIVRALEVTVGSGQAFSSFGPGLAASQTLDTGWDLIGLDTDRADLAERIARRYQRQMEAGFLDEVHQLRETYGDRISRTAAQGLGYRQLLAHLAGTCTLEEALAEANRATVAFAKRQQRWFRRNPKIDWRLARPTERSPKVHDLAVKSPPPG